ncbi:hypothetical protein [Domibacillus robiginosus]|uniref:hypothetical protein n=1 Tax=Domibacillus robiginosus TaxID=1071054 RepID=UPI00067AA61E|nr:hypothetical protein [Domibacillus robiginosus]
MSYILPIPQFQYNDYRERVLNETTAGYAPIDPASKVTFEKVMRDRSEPETQLSIEEQRKKRQSEHEAFRVHMAQISGRGVTIDHLA